MLCPYCKKEDFVPEVVVAHTEAYGSGIKNFRCLHCQKVVRAVCSLRVFILDTQKTGSDSDWL